MKRYYFFYLLIAIACLLVSCKEKTDHYEPHSLEELSGHRVCIVSGTVQQYDADHNLKDKGVEFSYFPSPTDCMMAVAQGKADVFYGSEIEAYSDAFRRQNLRVCQRLENRHSAIAIGMKKGRRELVDDFNAFMDSLSICGILDELVNRWFSVKNTDFHDCVKVKPVNMKSTANGARVLKIGVIGNSAPTTLLLDNGWTGAEIELIQLYAQSRGYSLQVEVYDFSGLIPALQADKIDIAAALMSVTEERKLKIDFSREYANVYSALITAGSKDKGESFQPQSFEDLTGHTVSLMEGSIQQDFVNKHLKDKGINFLYFPGEADCMMALTQGKADIFFGADNTAYNDAFRRQHLKICKTVDSLKGETGFGVKKGRTDLLNDLNAFIDSLDACGEKDEILNRWFDTKNTDFHDCVKIEPTDGKPQPNVPILTVGVAGIKPPTTLMIDNKWTGAEIELLQRYALARGLSLKVDVYDFGNLIPALQSDKVDVAASTLIINEERKQKIDFTHDFVVLKAAFITVDQEYTKGPDMFDKLKQSAYYSLIAENRWKLIVDGLWVTLLISVFSLLLGSVLACGVCWMSMSKNRIWQMMGRAYVNVLRNLPMLVLLMLMFYVFLAGFGLPTVVVAIIAFAMNSAAYISEIYRTGIEGVDKGQTEAGLALGFSSWQTFWYFIAPQAVKTALPVYKNEAVSLLKGTSLVGYISIIDMTKASDLIRSASFEAFFPLIIVSLIYFVLAWLFTCILDLLFKR